MDISRVEYPGLISRLGQARKAKPEIVQVLSQMARAHCLGPVFDILVEYQSSPAAFASLLSEIGDFSNPTRVLKIRDDLRDYDSPDCVILERWLRRYVKWTNN